MSLPFPIISEQKHPYAWLVTPDASVLEQLAAGIWDYAKQTQQRPLVVLSTAGPLMGVRAALEKYRPNSGALEPGISFLPQVMSFNDWLEAAPSVWKFPKKQSDLERWLAVYATIRKHSELQARFKAETEAGAWGLAQAIIQACDTLSAAIAPKLQNELHALIQDREHADIQIGQAWVGKLQVLLDQTIGEAYPSLARKVVDQEAQVLLAFWRYISSASDPAFRKQFAMAAYLEQAKLLVANHQVPRPLIWVETADATPIDQELIYKLLNDYAQYAPVVEIKMDWRSVGLWAESIGGEDAESQVARNVAKAHPQHWHLIAAKRFEELAWTAAKTIEEHLIDGKTNIALVAQDRLVARRARALLSRLGPSLKIQDETGWKLSTTRAAAALNAWLELIGAPSEGPTAVQLLEFLQNPFLEIPKILNQSPDICLGLIAQLEDLLIASQAHTGWQSFHLAIEGSRDHGSSGSNPLLLELLQSIRGRLNRWRGIKMNCAQAHEYLVADLGALGMTLGLEKDPAGKQLLEVLNTFDFMGEGHRKITMRISEWLSLLKTVIEESASQ